MADENSASTDYDPSKDPKRKAKSKDAGWKYGFWPDLADKNTVECVLCHKKLKGGIKRLKQHLTGGYGDVAKCSKTTTQISTDMHQALISGKRNKPLDLDDDNQEEQVESVDKTTSSTPQSSMPSSDTSSKNKKKKISHVPQARGPMDTHVRRSPEQVVDERLAGGKRQTTIENRMRAPEERERVIDHIADWFYECGIPFNAAKARSFSVMVESIAQYGPGIVPPSYHELRVPLLDKKKNQTEELRKKHEIAWKQYGCSLMSDGWSDKRGRHLINFLVNSPEGTFFLGSVDASRHIQDANLLFELLDSKIEEIGPENVTQIVTDNGSNYKAAGKMLMQKRPTLFWTPCAAHCLDLMLEDIGNLSMNKPTIAKAKRVTRFIYRHTRLLEAMRVQTDGKDLVRHAVTRFATSFLTLQSLYKYMEPLRKLFVSDDWTTSKLSKTVEGKFVADTILSTQFWNAMQNCLRQSQPLLVVLRIVDGDERPAMPELYMAMEKAKETIKKHFDGKERLYKKVIDIIERRWESQMGQQIHEAAMFLNPSKYFDFATKNPDDAWKFSHSFQDVLVKMVPDEAKQLQIMEQVNLYKESKQHFSRPLAIAQRETSSPLDWWNMYGGPCSELARLARRILSLCCSSSGCERNWSTFEFIHTKKRNRLEHRSLNDLVFIQYNRRLATRFQERREKGRNYDPLLLDDLDWSSEWMVSQDREDLVHGDGDDLTWRDVDEAIGASASLRGRNLPRKAHHASSSGSSARVDRCHGRSRTTLVDEDDSDLDVEEVEEVGVNDDEDLDDDFGQPQTTNPTTQNRSDPDDLTFLDDYD